MALVAGIGPRTHQAELTTLLENYSRNVERIRGEIAQFTKRSARYDCGHLLAGASRCDAASHAVRLAHAGPARRSASPHPPTPHTPGAVAAFGHGVVQT